MPRASGSVPGRRSGDDRRARMWDRVSCEEGRQCDRVFAICTTVIWQALQQVSCNDGDRVFATSAAGDLPGTTHPAANGRDDWSRHDPWPSPLSVLLILPAGLGQSRGDGGCRLHFDKGSGRGAGGSPPGVSATLRCRAGAYRVDARRWLGGRGGIGRTTAGVRLRCTFRSGDIRLAGLDMKEVL